MIPHRKELSRCTDCQAEILWTTTALNRKLAVDPKPDPGGNMACWRAGGRYWRSRSLDGTGALPPAPWEHVFMPHRATCTPRPIPPPSPPVRGVQAELPDLPGANLVVLDATRRRGRGRRR